MDQLPEHLRPPLRDLLLSVADDKFILGHRNADWTGLAPMLEEDIAFSSLAQDELAHALTLYQMVAEFSGGTADRLAYGRQPHEYLCAQLVEGSDDFNWAMAIARNFFCDHFDHARLTRLAHSAYTPLAHLGSRLAAEEQLHVEHVDAWVRRLGRGGEDSRNRMQEAFQALAPQAAMLWEPTQGLEVLEALGVYPKDEATSFDAWKRRLETLAKEAGLELSLNPPPANTVGGRRGEHGPTFAALLDELTEVYRVEPEATW